MFKNKQKNQNLYPLLIKVKLPPYSPDINVIELVWAEMKRFLTLTNIFFLLWNMQHTSAIKLINKKKFKLEIKYL